MDSSSICSLLELGCESDMPIYIYIIYTDDHLKLHNKTKKR